MKYLDHFVQTRHYEDANNYLLIRLIAATMVVYGHSYRLASECLSCSDVVMSLTGYRYSHTLGVNIFFIISGFLVTASYVQRDNLASYLKSRALRIFPGLIICVALTTFLVGPLYTSLPLWDYFRSPLTAEYFASNASLYATVFHLPGVVFSETPYGTGANGSLWTIPIEARLYLFVAFFGVLGLLKKGWLANIAMASALFIALALPEYLPLIESSSNNLRLAGFFLLGAALYNNRNLIPLDWKILAALLLAAAFSTNTWAFDYACSTVVAYSLFLFAYSKKIRLPRFVEDYSYGIYLYSFPIQQMIAHAMPEAGPYRMMLLSIPLAWFVGALSWHFIEKPCLSLKNKRLLFGQATQSRTSA